MHRLPLVDKTYTTVIFIRILGIYYLLLLFETIYQLLL